MAVKFEIKIRWGYIIAFFMLLLSYFFIFFTIRKLRIETKWTTHSYQVINILHSIKGELTDAETGVRGYLLTKDEKFLEPYQSGSKNVLPLYNELKELTNDNKSYISDINILGDLINRKMASLAFTIQAYEQNNFAIPSDILGEAINKNLMDSVGLMVNHLTEEEKKLRSSRTENLQSFFVSTEVITIVSLVVALLTMIYSLMTFNREERAKEEADMYAQAYRKELETRINELGIVNRELKELKSIEKFASTGRIARTIAHELRNPLTNISLATEQVKEIAADKPDAADLLHIITRNANRINQLVSDLLQSTRFVQLEYKKVNINDLLEITLALAQDRINLSNIHVEKDFDQNICDINVDIEKIKIAFLNLIVNAIEAMEKEPRVLKIATRTEDNKCVIKIEDNGIGMDEETQQRLFEPYFTSKQNGNGLGLTNTQNVILNHQGSINVYSKPGQGTTFIIKLNMD